MVSWLASKVMHVASSGAYITQLLYVHIPHPEMVGKAISLTRRNYKKATECDKVKKELLNAYKLVVKTAQSNNTKEPSI